MRFNWGAEDRLPPEGPPQLAGAKPQPPVEGLAELSLPLGGPGPKAHGLLSRHTVGTMVGEFLNKQTTQASVINTLSPQSTFRCLILFTLQGSSESGPSSSSVLGPGRNTTKASSGPSKASSAWEVPSQLYRRPGQQRSLS